jgi:hypothetical protein
MAAANRTRGEERIANELMVKLGIRLSPIFWISARVTEETGGRLVCRRLFHVHNSRDPLQCQATRFWLRRCERRPPMTPDV